MVEARPTIMTCVPRLYEVMRQTHRARRRAQGRHQRAAVRSGRSSWGGGDTGRAGCRSTSASAIDRAARPLVRRKVRQRFGGRLKAMVSGGAPLNPESGCSSIALGAAGAAGLRPDRGLAGDQRQPAAAASGSTRWGRRSTGVEVKIAEDGEILVRGELVMKRLLEGRGRDGAGAARRLAAYGRYRRDRRRRLYLRITDRKKDIIVNSGGDNVAPARVEGMLLLQPEIGQAMVYGDRRPHLVALMVPHPDFVRTFARAHKLEADLTSLAEDADFDAAIGEAVTRANRTSVRDRAGA